MLRKGATFKWTEQCSNVFKLLNSKLVQIPTLQYPNPIKPLKLFTDASKHSYSDILHQEETSKMPNAEANFIPIAYFSGSFSRTQQLWNTMQKEYYAIYQSIQKFTFYIIGTEFTLYCDHKSLTPFFTAGVSSPVLDGWALYLQQFNIKFQHIHGKKNVVADAMSQLRILGLYQHNDNEDIPLTTEDVIENIIEVHIREVIQKTPTYNVEKLILAVLRKEQQHD